MGIMDQISNVNVGGRNDGGAGLGALLGQQAQQNSPAAFLQNLLDARQQAKTQSFENAINSAKAKQAKLQEIVTHGAQIAEDAALTGRNLNPSELKMVNLYQRVKSNPVLMQAAGFDPDKGKLQNPFAFGLPSGLSSGDFQVDTFDNKGKVTFKRSDAAKGRGKATQKDFEGAQKLKKAVSIVQEFGEKFKQAVPDTGESAAQRRLSGLGVLLGAKTGIAPNPELLALDTQLKPFAIQTVRALGEVGNLTRAEQEAAKDLLNFTGKTNAEIDAQIKSFGEIVSRAVGDEARGVLGDLGIQGVPSVGSSFNGETVVSVERVD